MGSHELRPFVSTDYITHARHKPHLKGAKLTSQDLWDFVPAHELHTLGVLLRDTTSPDEKWSASVRERLSRAIGGQGVAVLDDIVRDLMNAPDGEGYQYVNDLVSDFAKLHRNYLAPAGIPELGLAAEFQYSVPTATGRAVMTPRFGALAGHRLVNRLHDVHQLESTYLKFPGATHTRKSHSLAVLHNARYYVSHLLNDSRFRRVAERQELEAALLLALLHDIGHFQLSHMFEDLATDQATNRGSEPWNAIAYDIPTDDTLFANVLGLPDAELRNPLRGQYTPLLQDLAQEKHVRAQAIAAESSYITLAELIKSRFGDGTLNTLISLHSIIYGKRKPDLITPSQRVLAAVVSSDIDADKTAYLIEDSQRTGVPYGLGVDLDGILGNLCMPTGEDIDRPGTGPLIGLRSAGIQAAQSVAVNRNQMLSQVYWNQSNRAVTAMVKYVLMKLLSAANLDMAEYLAIATFGSRNECMHWLASRFENCFGKDEINPVVGVIDGASLLYERVCEVRVGLVDDASGLNAKLVAMSYMRILSLQECISAALNGIDGLERLRPGELLVDIPSKEREKPSGERGGRVYVYDRFQVAGVGKPLEEASPLYQGLKTQHRDLNRVSRVYITPQRFQGLDQRARELCAHACVEALKEETGM
jgi:HD superfamily phosphohydrolase